MILVTGGAGFIGSNFIDTLIKNTFEEIVVADCFTYASALGYPYIKNYPILIEEIDIGKKKDVEYIFQRYNIKTVFNFAAESHVDNSINNVDPFLYTNINGTVNLLNSAVQHKVEKFIQISTDEVFGDIIEGSFNEQSLIKPSNPYSASKAAAEHFVWAFARTHGLSVNVVNCSNNYGPNQYPEKFIPVVINKILEGGPVPVYGQGKQMRDWIFVRDCCEAIYKVYDKGRVGERYCIGGGTEISNFELARKISNILGITANINFVTDRPGHDFRYSIDNSKISNELGWKPTTSLEKGLRITIDRIKQDANWV